jgi:FMN-dependent NADH-azoreductase
VLPLLVGIEGSVKTKKAIQLLSDAGIRHRWQEMYNTDSKYADMVLAISGTVKIPQLFVGGDVYIGNDKISRYIGN